MGTIRKITCSTCKNEWQCMEGCGLAHGRLTAAAGVFSEEVRRDIAGKVGDEKFPIFDFKYRISACDQCGNMVSVPVLNLMDHDAEYMGVCPVCGSTAGTAAYSDGTPCPSCGAETLTSEEVGHWD
ncbi:MAG: hypothetical protein NC416_14125 [Eubacterium sp.]|nr:hypothetical protein [Eubacterium sp.]